MTAVMWFRFVVWILGWECIVGGTYCWKYQFSSKIWKVSGMSGYSRTEVISETSKNHVFMRVWRSGLRNYFKLSENYGISGKSKSNAYVIINEEEATVISSLLFFLVVSLSAELLWFLYLNFYCVYSWLWFHFLLLLSWDIRILRLNMWPVRCKRGNI